MEGRMSASSHGSRFFVLKITWMKTLLSDWAMRTCYETRLQRSRLFRHGVLGFAPQAGDEACRWHWMGALSGRNIRLTSVLAEFEI